MMRLGILFSGGKDSCYAAYIAQKNGYDISCLISILSENPHSYMFHTPSIDKAEVQAKVMGIPMIVWKTSGEKEKELDDLESAIKEAKKKFKITGVATGAVESVYQASRVQKICNKLGLECFNPLWQKNQNELLDELIKNKFNIIITGVFAYPLDFKWLGRTIDKKYINDVTILNKKYGISPAGEGGEFESFVLDSPMFKRKLKITGHTDFGEKNSWRRELEVK
jgi:diphthine-ammonia ligase